MFRGSAISSPLVNKPLDATCAKMLNFSQNTASGMFAESQELGYASMPCLLLLYVTR
jgi:hypothetical protein